MGSYSDNSSGANQSPISLVADSKASEAWIRLRPTETAYWPRTEPASASSGLVAPTIRRLGGLVFFFFFPFTNQKKRTKTYTLTDDILALPNHRHDRRTRGDILDERGVERTSGQVGVMFLGEGVRGGEGFDTVFGRGKGGERRMDISNRSKG